MRKLSQQRKKRRSSQKIEDIPGGRDVEVEIKMEYSDGFSILETQVKSGLKLPTDLDYL